MEEQRLNMWSNKTPTHDNMLLVNDPLLCTADRKEVLGYLPNFSGASVIYLGSGIGRFLGDVARQAKDVTAVDLIQKFIDKSQTRLRHYNNINFICADVLKVDLPMCESDLVMSGWIFSNLNHKESGIMVERVLDWLKPAGHFFFRESGPTSVQHLASAGKNHPGHYRSPVVYKQLLENVTKDGYQLRISRCITSRAYFLAIGDANQVLYVAQKVPVTSITPLPPLPRLKESTPLPIPTIQRQQFQEVGFEMGSEVLVLGCGDDGGIALELASTCQTCVLGIVSSMAHFSSAVHHQQNTDPNGSRMVQFEMRVADAELEFKEASFDFILICEEELVLRERYRLLPQLQRWVRPEGCVYLIDNTTFNHQYPHGEVPDYIVVGCKEDGQVAHKAELVDYIH